MLDTSFEDGESADVSNTRISRPNFSWIAANLAWYRSKQSKKK